MYIKIKNNLKKNVFYLTLILFLLILLIILIRYLFNRKTIETFNLGRAISRGVKKATHAVSNVGNSAGNAIKNTAEDAANKVRQEAEAAAAAVKDAAAAAQKLIQDKLNVEAEIQKIINSEIGIIKDDIQNVVNGEINAMTGGIQNNLVNKIDTMTTTVGNNVNTTMVQKFTSVFSQMGTVLKNGIVNPILAFFTGIITIFVQLFNIIKTVADKIASLPNCIPFYVFDATSKMMVGFFKKFLPGFIFDFFNNIYQWTLGIFVNWFWDFVGWSDADQRCYNFNVDNEISQMNDATKNISNSFKAGFGDMNFNQLRF